MRVAAANPSAIPTSFAFPGDAVASRCRLMFTCPQSPVLGSIAMVNAQWAMAWLACGDGGAGGGHFVPGLWPCRCGARSVETLGTGRVAKLVEILQKGCNPLLSI
jgi:hypothetical protein